MSENDEKTERTQRADWLPLVSAIAALLLALIYRQRTDSLAALTIWPYWTFGLGGILVLLFKVRLNRIRARVIAVGIWLALWWFVGDEPRALARSIVGIAPSSLRVISLNCAGGQIEAAQEVTAKHADIVLLQESPNKPELEKLRQQLGKDWSLINGPDASILLRGQLKPVDLPKGTGNFMAAWATMAAIKEPVLVLSLRLNPPILRLDLWNPDCWHTLSVNKAARRDELEAIADFVTSQANDKPVILGGDFNTPPDRTITNCLDPLVCDSFVAAGRGWGATALNEYPMVRIDQIWASPHFKPVRTIAQKTQNSDHRMVIADFAD